jgi:hypothetical protein
MTEIKMNVKTAEIITAELKKAQCPFKKATMLSFFLAISYTTMTAGKTTAEGFERTARMTEKRTRPR